MIDVVEVKAELYRSSEGLVESRVHGGVRMSDPISRQDVLKLIENTPYDWSNITERTEMLRKIKALPSTVVRCKYCKFYKTPYCKIDIHTDIMTINRVHDDDFCSYGERGESEVTNG